MKAMILAAGMGTRMEPLTRAIAKPALPVLDLPVVRRLVDLLARQGVREVVVNAHAHPQTLRAALGATSVHVEILEEHTLRGSGGGVRGASAWLAGAEPFLVVNGDMYLDLELSDLLQSHRRSGALATLALRDDPRKQDFGTIGYDADERVCRVTQRLDLGAEKASGLFIGVQVMEPRIFSRMPDRDVFHLMSDVYVPALREGEHLNAWKHPLEAAWWPVGSPRELLDANLRALEREPVRRRVSGDAQVAGELHDPVWVGPGARIETGAGVGPHAVISAGAVVGRGANVQQSLVLPNSRVAAGATLRHAVAFADEVWRDD